MSAFGRHPVAGRFKGGTGVLSAGAVLLAGLAGGLAFTGPAAATGSDWSHAAAWGDNGSGRLGDGTQAQRLTPAAVSNAERHFVRVNGGATHSVAVSADGSAWAWGNNADGKLCDGTSSDKAVSVQMVGLSSVIDIGAGSTHSVALRSDGTVWACGHGGLVGDGTVTTRSIPVRVAGLTNVTKIAVGAYHTLALRSDGTVWAWGLNFDGRLGNGTQQDATIPVQVASLGNVVDIAAGPVFSLAVRSDGTAAAWGNNSFGELGDGTVKNRLTPVDVLGLSGVVDIAAGSSELSPTPSGFHSLAARSDGTVWAWGSNNRGQLGDGTTTDSLTPVQTTGLTAVTQISAGAHFSAARTADGKAWLWGSNKNGKLGTGSFAAQVSRPVAVPGLSGVQQVSAASAHTLVVRETPQPAISLSLEQTSGNVPRGGAISLPIAVNSVNGSGQSVFLTVSGLPYGVRAVFSSKTVPAGTVTMLAISADVGAPTDVSTITITGTANSPASTSTVQLNLSVSDPSE